MDKLCIGLLTYCNSDTHPERYEIFKMCLSSLRNIACENVYIYALDNGSSQDVIDDLNSSSYIDAVYLSRNNLYDFLAVNFLVKKANSIDAKYVMHLEDDFLFYKGDFLDSCINFLKKNNDCGYLRILKYDFNNKLVYDKIGNHKNKDMQNCQRHYNNISKDPLVWSEKQRIASFDFYKTNWHWYNFANICRLSVFEKIVPQYDCYPLQLLELEMMKNYHRLSLLSGVMDVGVVSHMGRFNKKTSTRLSFRNESPHEPKKEFPLLKIQDILDEIEYLL